MLSPVILSPAGADLRVILGVCMHRCSQRPHTHVEMYYVYMNYVRRLESIVPSLLSPPAIAPEFMHSAYYTDTQWRVSRSSQKRQS